MDADDVAPTRDELMADLAAMLDDIQRQDLPEREPGEYTMREIQEGAAGINPDTIRSRVLKKINNGIWSRRHALVDGLDRVVYRKVTR